MRIAALDLGTNTMLMTVADVAMDATISVVRDLHTIVRLGENVDSTGSIGDTAIERSMTCAKEYARVCDELQVRVRTGVATSAVRRAKNGMSVLTSLSEIFGGRIHAISGEEEARLTFSGSAPAGTRSAVIDIGGGSTEVAIGQGNSIDDYQSVDVGAVIVTEKFFNTVPASQQNAAAAIAFIRDTIKPLPQRTDYSECVAVAGTPTTLAAMLTSTEYAHIDRVEGYSLSLNNVGILAEKMLGWTLEETRAQTGVHRDRADILLAGTLILRELMTHLQRNSVRVSTRGLRFGVLHAAAQSALLRHTL